MLEERAFSESEPFLSFCRGLGQFEGPRADFVQGISVFGFVDDSIAAPGQPKRDGAHRVYVRVAVLPWSVTGDVFGAQIRNFAGQQPFQVVIDERMPAQLLASVGGGGTVFSGTLGGMLECKISGARYGLTCSHVATTRHLAVNLTDVGGTTISNAGTVSETNYSTFSGKALSFGALCNPALTPAPLQDVDAALITLNSGHSADNTVKSLGVINGINKFKSLGSGNDLRMSSAFTGNILYRIGGLAVTFKLSLGGTPYCFGNLLQTYCPPTASVLPAIARAFTSPPQAGDSGAWMFSEVPDPSNPGGVQYYFSGMLIGGNGVDGFSQFTDDILNWASSLSPALNLDTF
jgi:hypothetical protein